MIASQEKQDDLQAYVDTMAILEVAIRMYKKSGNEELLKHITEINDGKEWLKNKLETHDYSKPVYNPCTFTSESVY